MFDTMKYYGSVGARFIKMAIQTALEYPLNLAGWLLANPIQFLIGFATIKFVVQEFDSLNGWGFGELAFLYGLAVISHGLSVVLFIQTWYMGSIMIYGEMDVFMLRPMNVAFQFLFMEFNLIGFTDLIPGTMVFIYGCIQVGFHWSLANTLAMVLVIIGATLIRGALFLVTGSTAFWTKSNNRFSAFNLNLLDRTTMYPLSMYPRTIQFIFTFILPLGFISFYPASDFLAKDNGFSFPSGVVWLTIGVGILVFGLACKLFSVGLKRYESSGT